MNIPITKGFVAVIDNADRDKVARLSWVAHATPGKRCVYAKARLPGQNRNILMHRYILDAPPGVMIDHINGDGLDNRRGNLRVATASQNLLNRRKYHGVSRFKGVYFMKRDGLWVAQLAINGKSKNLGRFLTEEDAARVYDSHARRWYGDFALLNFSNKENHARRR